MADYIRASLTLAKEIKKLHITAREKAFADLMSLGWKDKDAYQVVGLFNPLINELDNWSNMKKTIKSPALCAYVPPMPTTGTEKTSDDTSTMVQPEDPPEQKEIPRREITDKELSEILSKENQLKDLAYKLIHGNLDTKSEIEIRKMIADIQQFKKEQVVEDDKKRIFFLPLKCYRCNLYLAEKNKKSKK